jgi:hypothetical protein
MHCPFKQEACNLVGIIYCPFKARATQTSGSDFIVVYERIVRSLLISYKLWLLADGGRGGSIYAAEILKPAIKMAVEAYPDTNLITNNMYLKPYIL